MDYGGKSLNTFLERLRKYDKYEPPHQYFDITNKIANKLIEQVQEFHDLRFDYLYWRGISRKYTRRRSEKNTFDDNYDKEKYKDSLGNTVRYNKKRNTLTN